ncbi:FG-GAP repeat domain-containing protein [Dokdonia ponticola]|uniref:FG-GAP repeat domain-containing protein n=1 Tax=Dokdonia ponticola TaxID=2041041 RepID=A0ABV9HV30_9FLAO
MKKQIILLSALVLMYSCQTEEPISQENAMLTSSALPLDEDIQDSNSKRPIWKFNSSMQASSTFGITDGWGNFTLKRVADVNGDGRADIIGFGINDTFVALGSSNGTFGSPILASTTFAYNDSWGFKSRHVSDVNGDGRADIIGFGNDATFVALGNSNGTFSTPIFANSNFGSSDGWQIYPKTVKDVNGDGRADIVGFGSDDTVVAFGQANGTFSTPFTASTNYGSNDTWQGKRREIADVNSDGRGDIVAYGNGGVWISLATTNGTFSTSFMVLPGHFHDRHFDFEPVRIADINGDNNMDIISLERDFVYLYYGEGDGNFTSPRVRAYDRFTYDAGWLSEHIRYVSDVNGDNKADIIGFGENATIVSLSID